jgi:hypothetical protein
MENETIDQPVNEEVTAAAPDAPAQANESQETEKKPQEVPQWALRRFGELTAARKAAEARAAQLEQQLQQRQAAPQSEGGDGYAQQQQPYSQQNVQELLGHMARDEAQKLVAQQTLAQRVNEIEGAGRKEFGDRFDQYVQNLQVAGVGGQGFIEILGQMQSPEKLVAYLGDPNNIEQAIKLANMTPVQMALEMTKIQSAANKSFAKQVSKAPAPIATMDSRGVAVDAEPDPSNTRAWIEYRNKNARKRR